MRRPLYQQFAVLLQAKQNCLESGNTEWYHKHSERIWRLGKDHLPSGSGLDRTPSLANVFDVRISGRNRNDVKPYLHETFSAALRQEVEP
jgi:hypothetical protein